MLKYARSNPKNKAMSGHSHFATIRRQKEVKDAAKGQIFSKMARLITIAAKTGGGPDPESNYKLWSMIEKARTYNMPKDNIERAISKAMGGDALEEITYEGFGPKGVSVMIETATDNRNRTAQTIKGMLEKAGGSLGGPGSVAYNFEPKGFILVTKQTDVDSQMLSLIDLGAEDVEEQSDGVGVYVSPSRLREVKEKMTTGGQTVVSSELIQKPKNFVELETEAEVEKFVNFIDLLEDHDDVNRVFTNVDIPDHLIKK